MLSAITSPSRSLYRSSSLTALPKDAYKHRSVLFGSKNDTFERSPRFFPDFPKPNPEQEQEILNALRKPEAMSQIGHGYEGVTYSIQIPGLSSPYIIKLPHVRDRIKGYGPVKQNVDMRKEARLYQVLMIGNIDPALQLIGCVYMPKRGNGIILKYVPGQPADPDKNPLTSNKLEDLIEKLYQMDRLGLYHRDLSGNNILIEGNRAHPIDYSGSFIYNPFDPNSPVSGKKGLFDLSENNLYKPPFSLMQNSMNFEVASFLPYLQTLVGKNRKKAGAAAKALSEFLSIQGKGLQQYLDFIREHHPEIQQQEAILYETLRSRALETHPDILAGLEIWKMQAILYFRKAVNSKLRVMPPLEGKRESHQFIAWGMQSAQKMSQVAEKLMQKYRDDPDFKTYLAFEIRYGQFLSAEAKAHLPKRYTPPVLPETDLQHNIAQAIQNTVILGFDSNKNNRN